MADQNTSINERLEALRAQMSRYHIGAVIIPNTDAHHSEYVADYFRQCAWISGFTGSNATVVVTHRDARLWTDSRYFLQADIQLRGSEFTLMKEGVADALSIEEWLATELQADDVLAIDGMLFSVEEANRLEEFCLMNGYRFATDFAPFDEIWEGRGWLGQDPLFIHGEQYAGESAQSKIERVLESVRENDADGILLSALDEIAWLLNLRCSDIAYTPVFISFVYLSETHKALFIDTNKVTDEVAQYLNDLDFEVYPYERIEKYLGKLDAMLNVQVDAKVVSDTLCRAMACGKVFSASPIALMKAVKNEAQIQGIRSAMQKDGVALLKAFRWLEENVASETVTEMSFNDKLIEYRREQPLYMGDSFAMIAGYNEHGAIVHYTATKQSNATLRADGMFLVDTGAQFLDGTTDITRTVFLGRKPSAEQCHDYTLVLKGHIAIATQQFPRGTNGSQLDVLARQYLWNENLTYLHGTGHGVGHFLGVHEGPQGIRLNYMSTPLTPGMITSNEPGLYRTGKYGIRIENLTLVQEAVKDEEFGEFCRFETLSLFPFESKLIEASMLTRKELDWVNAYHKMVYDRLSPYLNSEEQKWLMSKTSEIKQ